MYLYQTLCKLLVPLDKKYHVIAYGHDEDVSLVQGSFTHTVNVTVFLEGHL